jgi:Holliday junction resolvasome RuvABC endonuclease subunit
MLVLGIDPGLRNIGYCLMHNGKCVLVGLDDLFLGAEIAHAATHEAIMQWAIGHKDLINEADVVMVEKQFIDGKMALSAALVVVQTVLQTVAHGKCRLVHASTIKSAYKTRRANHPKNKEAATDMVMEIEPDLQRAFSSGCETITCLTNKKAGDIQMHHVADAYLLCHWFFYKGRATPHGGSPDGPEGCTGGKSLP